MSSPGAEREEEGGGDPTELGWRGEVHWRGTVEKGPVSTSRLQLVVAFLTKADMEERRQP